MNILQTVFLRALENEIGSLIELRRRGNAVQTGQGAQIFVWGRAAGFVAQV
jgi:hypothetical protein